MCASNVGRGSSSCRAGASMRSSARGCSARGAARSSSSPSGSSRSVQTAPAMAAERYPQPRPDPRRGSVELVGCSSPSRASTAVARRPRPRSWPSAAAAAGREVVPVREPGGTAPGERIRSVLLDPELRDRRLGRGAALRRGPRAARRGGDPAGARAGRDRDRRPLRRLLAGLSGLCPRAGRGRGARGKPGRHPGASARPHRAARARPRPGRRAPRRARPHRGRGGGVPPPGRRRLCDRGRPVPRADRRRRRVGHAGAGGRAGCARRWGCERLRGTARPAARPAAARGRRRRAGARLPAVGPVRVGQARLRRPVRGGAAAIAPAPDRVAHPPRPLRARAGGPGHPDRGRPAAAARPAPAAVRGRPAGCT